jgi:hypothetical protein
MQTIPITMGTAITMEMPGRTAITITMGMGTVSSTAAITTMQVRIILLHKTKQGLTHNKATIKEEAMAGSTLTITILTIITVREGTVSLTVAVTAITITQPVNIPFNQFLTS